jgi:hypothetical protein
MKLSTDKRKETRKSERARGRERSTMSERESSDALSRKRATKKDEPENHTRLMGGKKGHVTY